ncbi:MAG: hypothetical protein P8H33_09660 [Crocinitomicaceae bacterium]|nr:hypothetical protein [Crocinitomicaceae bacterium]
MSKYNEYAVLTLFLEIKKPMEFISIGLSYLIVNPFSGDTDSC